MADHKITLSDTAEKGFQIMCDIYNAKQAENNQLAVDMDEYMRIQMESVGVQPIAKAQRFAAVQAKIAAGTKVTQGELQFYLNAQEAPDLPAAQVAIKANIAAVLSA